jgi:hypothetical protein
VTHTSAQLIVQSAPHFGGCLYSTHSSGGSRKVVGVMAAAGVGTQAQQQDTNSTGQQDWLGHHGMMCGDIAAGDN